MKLGSKHRFILYALYCYLKEANKKLKGPLQTSVSKIVFIELMNQSRIADKSQRALYKNLEILEKKKLIRYVNKFLMPTPKGMKYFKEMDMQLAPYFHMTKLIKKAPQFSRKTQAFFK